MNTKRNEMMITMHKRRRIIREKSVGRGDRGGFRNEHLVARRGEQGGKRRGEVVGGRKI